MDRREGQRGGEKDVEPGGEKDVGPGGEKDVVVATRTAADPGGGPPPLDAVSKGELSRPDRPCGRRRRRGARRRCPSS